MRHRWPVLVEPGSFSPAQVQGFLLPSVFWKTGTESARSLAACLGRWGAPPPSSLPLWGGVREGAALFLLLLVILRPAQLLLSGYGCLVAAFQLCLLSLCPQVGTPSVSCVFRPSRREKQVVSLCQAQGSGPQPETFAKGKPQDGAAGTVGPWRLL